MIKEEIDTHSTRLYTSFYYENHLNFPMVTVQKGKDGRLIADWPCMITDGPIGGYSVAETGAYVLEAFKKPQEWIGELRAFEAILGLH